MDHILNTWLLNAEIADGQLRGNLSDDLRRRQMGAIEFDPESVGFLFDDFRAIEDQSGRDRIAVHHQHAVGREATHQILQGAVLDNLSVINDNQPLAELFHVVQIVGR